MYNLSDLSWVKHATGSGFVHRVPRLGAYVRNFCFFHLDLDTYAPFIIITNPFFGIVFYITCPFWHEHFSTV